jgi:putative phosphoribosyl transferase
MLHTATHHAVRIDVERVTVEGDVRLPDRASGLVLFVHGSGSSRFSHRNRAVAGALESAGFGTLLLDLLTAEEESLDARTHQYGFDVEMLASRVVGATDWAQARSDLHDLPIAYFGASTGAAAALMAAASRPQVVRAVISRGGRPDLVASALPQVEAPTLLIVGGLDEVVIDLNREAMQRMRSPVELVIVQGAAHLFEEQGALDDVARLAIDWCWRHLVGRRES